MGRSVERLINRSDERHCFRLIKVSYWRILVIYGSWLPANWPQSDCAFSANIPCIVIDSHTQLSFYHSPKDRVYYISESVMKATTSINKDNLLASGTCLGKFTKSGKFRLHITALDYLAQYSKVCGNLTLCPSSHASLLPFYPIYLLMAFCNHRRNATEMNHW